MTTSHYSKVLKQIKMKPTKVKKFAKHNTPKERKYGKGVLKCQRCGRYGAHISKYNLHLCRHCFREIATKIGFKQYN